VVRPGLPEPIGNRLGVVAKALLALSQRCRGTLVFRDFERQCVIDLGEFGDALGHLSLKAHPHRSPPTLMQCPDCRARAMV
jgi:hypothetical protein